MQVVVHVVFGTKHDSTEAAALPVDVFCCGIDHHVGAVRERALQHRRRKYVVDDHDGADAVREIGNRLNIDEVECAWTTQYCP